MPQSPRPKEQHMSTNDYKKSSDHTRVVKKNSCEILIFVYWMVVYNSSTIALPLILNWWLSIMFLLIVFL